VVTKFACKKWRRWKSVRPSDGSSGVGGVWCGGVCVFVLMVWCGVMVWVVVCAEKNFEKFLCAQ